MRHRPPSPGASPRSIAARGAGNELTRPHEGAGPGLAISRDLARGMGGELAVSSTIGVGSTFSLTLPRADRD